MSTDTTLSPSDKQLVARILQKDEQAFLMLYKRHESYVRALVARNIQDRQVQDEVVQEVFIALIEALRAWRSADSRLTTFLYTIARNKSVDHIRRARARRLLYIPLSPKLIRGLHVLLDGQIEQAELAQRIERVMKTLPHDYALVLRLKYIELHAVKEIAQELKLSIKSVESLLFRARRAFATTYGRIVD